MQFGRVALRSCTTSMKIRFTNEHAVMDARSGRQHLVVQGTKAFYRGNIRNGKNLGKQCALPEELHNLACCSNWNLTLTNFTREVEQNRLSRNVSLRNYHYCKNDVGYTTTNPSTPCGAYEGHCRNDKDCQFGTKCAMLAASKYGMIDGGSACIPITSSKSSFGQNCF